MQADGAGVVVTRPKLGRLRGGVLVIDDEDSVREVTCMGLEALGCTLFAAADGAQGIALYRRHRDQIDAVIVDMEMPGLSGAEVFEALVCENPDVQVVITSGYGEEEMARRFSGMRPAGFLSKPHRVHVLYSMMRGILPPSEGESA